MNQPECYGIRIINSINDKGERDIIIIGVDDELNNITKLPNGKQALFSGGGKPPCPPLPPGQTTCP